MNVFSSLLVKFISWCVCALPLSAQFLLGDFIGILWFDILRIRRNTAIANLAIAFPDMPLDQRRRLARKSVCHIGRTFIEFWRTPAMNPEDWLSQFDIVGRENLNLALSRGHGAFLLTAHIGNGDWATVGLALNGFKLHIISKEIKWQPLNDFWFKQRRRWGTEFLADRQSSLTILKLLKKNEIVVYMLDQFLGPPIGIETHFFGRPTGTPMGLALLAGRAKAAVVPTYTYRLPDGRTRVVFEPEIPFVESGDKEQTIKDMTQKYCDTIEGWVRTYPEQWMWVHRRWKKFIDHRKLSL